MGDALCTVYTLYTVHTVYRVDAPADLQTKPVMQTKMAATETEPGIVTFVLWSKKSSWKQTMKYYKM